MPWLDKLWDKNPILNKILVTKSSPIVVFALKLISSRVQETSTHKGLEESYSKKEFFAQFLEAKRKREDLPDWCVFILYFLQMNSNLYIRGNPSDGDRQFIYTTKGLGNQNRTKTNKDER